MTWTCYDGIAKRCRDCKQLFTLGWLRKSRIKELQHFLCQECMIRQATKDQ